MNRRELLKFGAMAIATSPALPLEGFALVPTPALEFVPLTLTAAEEAYIAWRLRQQAEIFAILADTNALLYACTWRETSRSNVVASRGGEGSQGSKQTTL